MYIRKGDIVEVNYHAMGRDESFWGDDAGSFRPERWEFTPFGGGPRSCPGMRLVFTESSYVLVSLLRLFDRVENRDPELSWIEEFRLTVQSKHGCLVALIPSEV